MQKTADKDKIKEVSVRKGIFSENAYLCIYMYQTSSFKHNPTEFQTEGGGDFINTPTPLPSTEKQTSGKPTQIMVKLVYPYAKFLSTFFYYIRITAQIKRRRDSVPYPIHYDQRDIILLNNNDTENCSNNTIIKMKRGKENINTSELKQKSSELHTTYYRHLYDHDIAFESNTMSYRRQN